MIFFKKSMSAHIFIRHITNISQLSPGYVSIISLSCPFYTPKLQKQIHFEKVIKYATVDAESLFFYICAQDMSYQQSNDIWGFAKLHMYSILKTALNHFVHCEKFSMWLPYFGLDLPRTTEVHGRMTHWEFLKIRTEQKYRKIVLITFIHLQKLYKFWKLWGFSS